MPEIVSEEKVKNLIGDQNKECLDKFAPIGVITEIKANIGKLFDGKASTRLVGILITLVMLAIAGFTGSGLKQFYWADKKFSNHDQDISELQKLQAVDAQIIGMIQDAKTTNYNVQSHYE